MRLPMALPLALLVVLLGTTVAGQQPGAAPASKPVYGVGLITIDDREAYRVYERGFGPIFQRFEGTLLASSESPAVIEGEWPWTRTVLIRFPSREAFERWYQSEEYQALAQTRKGASSANLILVDGRP